MKTFKDFLISKHAAEFPKILHGGLADAFDEWLTELQVDELIKYADEYAAIQKQEMVEGVEKEIRLRKVCFGSEIDFENYIACIKQVLNK